MGAEPASQPERLLTMREVADWLGVPLGTAYVWRSRGGGPPGIRVGRHVRYRRQDVERWLEQRRAPTAA